MLRIVNICGFILHETSIFARNCINLFLVGVFDPIALGSCTKLNATYNGYSLFTVYCTDKDIVIFSLFNQKTKTEQKISYSIARLQQFELLLFINNFFYPCS